MSDGKELALSFAIEYSEVAPVAQKAISYKKHNDRWRGWLSIKCQILARDKCNKKVVFHFVARSAERTGLRLDCGEPALIGWSGHFCPPRQNRHKEAQSLEDAYSY